MINQSICRKANFQWFAFFVGVVSGKSDYLSEI